MRNQSVGLVHNIPSPYRLPIFERMSEECDLRVYFCTTSHEDRYWTPDLSSYSFDHVFLNALQIGIFYISLSVFFKILWDRHDAIVISENPPTVFITICTMLAGKLSGAKIIFWNEAWNECVTPGDQNRAIGAKIVDIVLSSGIRLYRRFLCIGVDQFIAFSNLAEDYLIQLGVSVECITTSHQVMPREELPDPQNLDRITRWFSNEKISYLYLGYLRPGKGIELLLDSFEEVRLRNDKCELLIAGSGEQPYEQELRERGGRIDDVKFIGHVQEGKADCYTHADVLVLPTYRDAWGLVINEALYYGTPVITTEAAAGKEVIGDNGIIVPAGDKLALMTAMMLCLSHNILGKLKSVEVIRNKLTDPEIMSNALLTACERSQSSDTL